MTSDNTEDPPPPPQSTARFAWIHIANKTKDIFEVQILHKYTGDDIQSTDFVRLEPDDDKYVLKVNYTTGFLTTGVDNWKVNAVKLVETGDFNSDGTKRYKRESYRIGHSIADDWKKHTLTGADHDRVTTIRLLGDEVEFDSPSGKSYSNFHKEKD